MPRTPLPIGTWGEISTRTMKTTKNHKPVKQLAHARFRDHDGRVRAVTATGTTKTAARTALCLKLQNRAKTNHSGDLTAAHKVNHLLDLWERRFENLVADETRSPTSLATYRRALKNHVRPAIGELHIGEATTQRLDIVLAEIKHHAGAAAARTCRAVISGAMKLAVRYGAITVNPAREVDTIEAKPKNPPRARLRKPPPPPSTKPATPPTRSPTNSAKPKSPSPRTSNWAANPAAAQALEHAFDDPDLP